MDQERHPTGTTLADELNRLSRQLAEAARLAQEIEDRSQPPAEPAPEMAGSSDQPAAAPSAATITKDLEAKQEDLRNLRQRAQTAFQTADQRTNELMNIMATILKTMNDMRSATNRGMG